MRTNIIIDDELAESVKRLKKHYATHSLAYIVRLALRRLDEKILEQNIDTSISSSIYVPDLPGMSEAVVRSQMVRFGVTAADYERICRETIDSYASTGTAIKNPEAVIYGRLKAFVKGRNAQGQPKATAEPKREKSYLELQQEILEATGL